MESLFSETIVPGLNPKYWPKDLLSSFVELSNVTHVDETGSTELERLALSHHARDLLADIWQARVEKDEDGVDML